MSSPLTSLTLTLLLLPNLLLQPSLTSAASTITTKATTTTAPKTCNGQPTYCTKRYSELTHLGAHDSPFVGPLPQHNQNLEVTEQLDLGIRFLQGQTHKALDDDDTAIRLCHTSCLLEDAGTLVSFLETVKSWLDTHPDEVVSLLLTNGDNLPVSRFEQAFAEAKADQYAFVPEGSPDVLAMEKWPTLGNLIEKNKRLVVFLGVYPSPSSNKATS